MEVGGKPLAVSEANPRALSTPHLIGGTGVWSVTFRYIGAGQGISATKQGDLHGNKLPIYWDLGE